MSLTLSLGLLLAAGIIGGLIAARVRAPEVTLYIIMGLLLGPSLAGWIPIKHLHALEPVLQLALATVLFDIGTRFPLHTIQRILRPALALSFGEISATFVLVFFGLWAAGESWNAALMLGGLAISTAPATTIVVLRQYDSDGPITGYTYILVALNNLAAIVAFEVLFLVVGHLRANGAVELVAGGQAPGIALQLGRLAIHFAVAAVVGVVGGLLISFLAERFKSTDRMVLVFTVLAIVLGLCESLEIPYLLAFLAMGITVANTSSLARGIVAGLEPVTELLYLVFFVVAGAELDVRAMLAAGSLGVVYIAMRLLGKYFGVRMMAQIRREPRSVRRWLGATLIAQAGAAIGLVAMIKKRDPELGTHLQSIIVGTVVFFELVGPVLAGLAVLRSGEVPMAHFVRPQSAGWSQALRRVLTQIRLALGRDPWPEKSIASLTVADLMRRNPQSIPLGADFQQVLNFVEHSRQHTYPVVDEAGELAGVIAYDTIRSTLFHQDEVRLIRAADLTEPVQLALHPGQPVDEALRLLERDAHDVIPVVAPGDHPRLVGLIERRDVVRFVKRKLSRG